MPILKRTFGVKHAFVSVRGVWCRGSGRGTFELYFIQNVIYVFIGFVILFFPPLFHAHKTPYVAGDRDTPWIDGGGINEQYSVGKSIFACGTHALFACSLKRSHNTEWFLLGLPLRMRGQRRGPRPSSFYHTRSYVSTRIFLHRNTSDGNSMLSGHIFAVWLRTQTFALGRVGVTTSKGTLFTFIISYCNNNLLISVSIFIFL